MFVEGRNKQTNDIMQSISLAQWSDLLVVIFLAWLLAGSDLILEENSAFIPKALCTSGVLTLTGLASMDSLASLPFLEPVSYLKGSSEATFSVR